MTIENQVTNRETGEKLVALGVIEKSYFVWHRIRGDWEITEQHHCTCMGTVSAFTVAELGEILRSHVDQMRNIVIREHRERIRQLMQRVNRSWQNEDEVNDRGKMLIYLLENKLISTPLEAPESGEKNI